MPRVVAIAKVETDESIEFSVPLVAWIKSSLHLGVTKILLYDIDTFHFLNFHWFESFGCSPISDIEFIIVKSPLQPSVLKYCSTILTSACIVVASTSGSGSGKTFSINSPWGLGVNGNLPSTLIAAMVLGQCFKSIMYMSAIKKGTSMVLAIVFFALKMDKLFGDESLTGYDFSIDDFTEHELSDDEVVISELDSEELEPNLSEGKTNKRKAKFDKDVVLELDSEELEPNLSEGNVQRKTNKRKAKFDEETSSSDDETRVVLAKGNIRHKANKRKAASDGCSSGKKHRNNLGQANIKSGLEMDDVNFHYLRVSFETLVYMRTMRLYPDGTEIFLTRRRVYQPFHKILYKMHTEILYNKVPPLNLKFIDESSRHPCNTNKNPYMFHIVAVSRDNELYKYCKDQGALGMRKIDNIVWRYPSDDDNEIFFNFAKSYPNAIHYTAEVLGSGPDTFVEFKYTFGKVVDVYVQKGVQRRSTTVRFPLTDKTLTLKLGKTTTQQPVDQFSNLIDDVVVSFKGAPPGTHQNIVLHAVAGHGKTQYLTKVYADMKNVVYLTTSNSNVQDFYSRVMKRGDSRAVQYFSRPEPKKASLTIFAFLMSGFGYNYNSLQDFIVATNNLMDRALPVDIPSKTFGHDIVCLVDEYRLVDRALLYALIKFVRQSYTKSLIIFSGDDGQCQAIGSSRKSHDSLIYKHFNHYFFLKHHKRSNCNLLTSNLSLYEMMGSIGQDNFHSIGAIHIGEILESLSQNKMPTTRIIVLSNKQVDYYHRKIFDMVHKKFSGAIPCYCLGDDKCDCKIRLKHLPQCGAILLDSKVSQNTKLPKGTVVQIQSVEQDKIMVSTESGYEFPIVRKKFNFRNTDCFDFPLEMNLCVTAYRAQGFTMEGRIYIDPAGMSAENLYVAVSRARYLNQIVLLKK